MDDLKEIRYKLSQERLRFRNDVNNMILNLKNLADDLEKAIGEVSRADAFLAFSLEMITARRRIEERMNTPAYVCPSCEMISYNPNDVENKYCGHCSLFGDFGE